MRDAPLIEFRWLTKTSIEGTSYTLQYRVGKESDHTGVRWENWQSVPYVDKDDLEKKG